MHIRKFVYVYLARWHPSSARAAVAVPLGHRHQLSRFGQPACSHAAAASFECDIYTNIYSDFFGGAGGDWTVGGRGQSDAGPAALSLGFLANCLKLSLYFV